MQVNDLPNADASILTVDSTAEYLFDLIEEAAGEEISKFAKRESDALLLFPEDGDIRILLDGNTPTSEKGILISEGVPFSREGVLLKNIQLISTSGSVQVGVQIGKSTNDNE